MTDLSDTQRAVLTAALARKDRCLYPITVALKGGAVGNVARSLLKRGLVEEVSAGTNSVWRHAEDGTALTLRATSWPTRRWPESRRQRPSPLADAALVTCGPGPRWTPTRS